MLQSRRRAKARQPGRRPRESPPQRCGGAEGERRRKRRNSQANRTRRDGSPDDETPSASSDRVVVSPPCLFCWPARVPAPARRSVSGPRRWGRFPANHGVGLEATSMADESYPQELKYYKEHDWVRIEGDEAVFGITWFAQDALGEIVYAELPDRGHHGERRSEPYGELESVKAVSDVYAPLSGEVRGTQRPAAGRAPARERGLLRRGLAACASASSDAGCRLDELMDAERVPQPSWTRREARQRHGLRAAQPVRTSAAMLAAVGAARAWTSCSSEIPADVRRARAAAPARRAQRGRACSRELRALAAAQHAGHAPWSASWAAGSTTTSSRPHWRPPLSSLRVLHRVHTLSAGNHQGTLQATYEYQSPICLADGHGGRQRLPVRRRDGGGRGHDDGRAVKRGAGHRVLAGDSAGIPQSSWPTEGSGHRPQPADGAARAGGALRTGGRSRRLDADTAALIVQ